MSLSHSHIDTCPVPIALDIPLLASELERRLPEAIFALLLGSAAPTGVIPARSDLDLAFYLQPNTVLSLDFQARIENAVDAQTQGRIRVDAGTLNQADPVYRFEALKGKLLFCRNDEVYLDFFSRTSRDYEMQMVLYARQRAYRLSRKMTCN